MVAVPTAENEQSCCARCTDKHGKLDARSACGVNNALFLARNGLGDCVEHTELAELFRRGEYRPQTPEEAAALCAKLLPMFESAGIRVIRLGLHSGGDVEGSFVAGAYHPALREMCEGHIYFDIISKALAGRERGRYTIYVAPREVSKAAGQRRCNLEKLKELGYECRIKESARLTARDIDLEKVNLL